MKCVNVKTVIHISSSDHTELLKGQKVIVSYWEEPFIS